MVTYANSVTAFVSICLNAFRVKKKGDCHSEITLNTSGERFYCLLSLLEPNTVIFIDNASCHSGRSQCSP